jgi:hypothetical protein
MSDGTRSATTRNYRLGAPIECAECGETADLYTAGWRAHRVDGPFTDELPALAFLCPHCIERELG